MTTTTRPKEQVPRYCSVPKLEWAARPDPTPVLLASGLEPTQVEAILQPYGLHRIQDADANLQSMAGDPHQRRQLAEILPALLEAIGRTADPDQALNHWERWLASGVSRSAVLEYLRSAPRMLDLVCAIFGNSDSLAFTLVRDPLLLYWLGLPVPQDMQGEVPLAVLENAFARQRPVRSEPAHANGIVDRGDRSSATLTPADEREVLERLHRLGYL